MILAAGRGSRLAASGNNTPKALLDVGGNYLIDYHLARLAACNIKRVVINVHYQAEQIQQALGDGSRYGLQIIYSVEEQPLGTGGGVKRALPLLGDQPFILLSADTWSDYPLDQLELPDGQLAHIILTDNTSDNPNGDFDIDSNRHLQKSGASKYTYASLGVLQPAIFAMISDDIFGLMPPFRYAIEQHRATGEYYTGRVVNVNTAVSLQQLREQLNNE